MDENEEKGSGARGSVVGRDATITEKTGGGRGPLWPMGLAVLVSVGLVALAAVALTKTHARSQRSPCEALRVEWLRGEERPVVTNLRGLKRLARTPGGGLEARGFDPKESFGAGPVLVNFWMTSCKPCLAELPSLLGLATRWESHGGALVLVATDEEKSLIEGFYRRHPGLWPQGGRVFLLWDPGGRVANRMGTSRYPETFLMAPSGRVVFKVAADRDWESLAARRCLLHTVRRMASSANR